MSPRPDGGSAADTGSNAPSIESVSGTGVPVRGNDVDTDQIIPARFLKAVTFEGLGQFAFFDQRFDANDDPKDHPFNEDRYRGASVLVVNANFGCGSSREHAPQALMRWGIDAVVGESFAEIFAGNCLALGIPTVTADREDVRALQDWVAANPDGDVDVDVESETVTFGDRTVRATVDDSQRQLLVEGKWDTTALLRSNAEAVRDTARSLPYVDEEQVPEEPAGSGADG
ncbi:3-isopropylmalate dehydratase small subunit [Halobacteriales archaeon QS_8_69_26]|nr:MAG: 3-isopropylmalate dehydratase small subunit [Halobacteriales archaeon QS_8_69_26]